jgi:glutamate/tyrosine decarboxylase-like PLP-dependent enzyme
MGNDSLYRPVLQDAFSYALEYLGNLENAPVAATATYRELVARLARPLADQGLEAEQVIRDLVEGAAGGVLGSAGGRFYGMVIGGSLPAALAADWITSAWDQNAALYASAPAETVIEQVAGEWLKELLGLPRSASLAFVTGSQVAHVTCLAAARHHLLAERGWDAERQGVAGAPQIRLLTTRRRHGSLERAVRILGLGTDNIEDLDADEQERLQADVLERTLAGQPDRPAIVLLQAGDLNIGAFDPFHELVPVAHRYSAWVHVDGAFGLWAAASPAHRDLVRGMDQADSWVTDGHKWLNVPYDCGYAFVAHPEAHRDSMSYRASYLVQDGEARDPMDWNPEWSRRGRGVATYAALRQLGRQGVADLVERTCRFAGELVTRIGALAGAEAVWRSRINQGLVRYLDATPGATEADHDRRTDAVIAEVLRTGEAFFGGTTWRGKRCMRVSVCNWQTDERDVERSVAAVQQVLERFARSDREGRGQLSPDK